MDKSQFIKVLKHYCSSSLGEAQDILLLKEDFPYSQVLHTLAARVSQDHGFSNRQNELQLAAVYIADRGVLKSILTEDYEGPLEDTSPSTFQQPEKQYFTTTNENVAEEVIHDLERLIQLKHNFEMLFVNVDTTSLKQESNKESPDVHSKDSKSKKERIIELAKAITPPTEEKDTNDTEPPKIKGKRKKKDDDGDNIIEEIVTKKEALVPENEKQKEQIEIIEHFIKIQPSITSAKDKAPVQSAEDLNTIRTGEFGDNIVSETLVEILLKQGKKDKAIEVLKKLIWKFPQKKAYFAAQIEDLKK